LVLPIATIKMKHSISILVFFAFAIFSFRQNPKENEFTEAVKSIIYNLSNRDSIGLSKYIDTKMGTWLLYRNGTKDTYEFRRTIGFSDTTFPNFPFYDKARFTRIKYSTLPIFDCGTQKFSKIGVFTDTIHIDHLLSTTAIQNGDSSKNQILPIEILENIGRRIVVADNNGNELIFYLSYYDNKWWLTILDKLTCDCSA